MIDVKIHCPCGQHYVFAVDPANGNLATQVKCPACGKDGTKAANEQIARAQIFQTPAKPAPSKKPIVVLITASILVGLVVVGAFLWRDREQDYALTPAYPPQTATPRQPYDPSKPFYPPDATVVGVGILVYKKQDTGKYTVGKVFTNSPAAKAGIKAGNILTKIDDQLIEPLTLGEVAQMIRGPVGSSVSMEIIRPKMGKTNQLQLVRDRF